MVIPWIGGVLLIAAGCSGSSSGATMGPEPEATALAPIKVDLPPAPSFAASDIPDKIENAYTVHGLRKNKSRICVSAPGKEQPPECLLGKDVTVRGYLIEVYQCPVCPKGQTCKLCDQPHLYLGDKADMKKEKALMVVDYLLPKQKPPILTVGKQYDIQGTFSINSPTGFGSSEGLLVFGKMKDDKGIEFLSTALQLEQKALAGEKLEEEMLKKKKKP